jgi:hypothetical protein
MASCSARDVASSGEAGRSRDGGATTSGSCAPSAAEALAPRSERCAHECAETAPKPRKCMATGA